MIGATFARMILGSSSKRESSAEPLRPPPYNAVCSSLGHSYITQLNLIYIEMLSVYK